MSHHQPGQPTRPDLCSVNGNFFVDRVLVYLLTLEYEQEHARKEFRTFPVPAQRIVARALTVAAEGSKADIAKPLKGLGSGVFEVALPYRSDAYRVVYAVQLDATIWVVHAFQKKSTTGIKTSQKDIDLVRERIKRLKEALR